MLKSFKMENILQGLHNEFTMIYKIFEEVENIKTKSKVNETILENKKKTMPM